MHELKVHGHGSLESQFNLDDGLLLRPDGLAKHVKLVLIIFEFGWLRVDALHGQRLDLQRVVLFLQDLHLPLKSTHLR